MGGRCINDWHERVGKCAHTLHNYIFANGWSKINKQEKSIVIGLVYVCTNFEAIGTLLQKDVLTLGVTPFVCTVQKGPKGQNT